MQHIKHCIDHAAKNYFNTHAVFSGFPYYKLFKSLLSFILQHSVKRAADMGERASLLTNVSVHPGTQEVAVIKVMQPVFGEVESERMGAFALSKDMIHYAVVGVTLPMWIPFDYCIIDLLPLKIKLHLPSFQFILFSKVKSLLWFAVCLASAN